MKLRAPRLSLLLGQEATHRLDVGVLATLATRLGRNPLQNRT